MTIPQPKRPEMSASSSVSELSEPATSEENRTGSSTSTKPPTPDDISRWSCHISLQKFGEELQAAADAAFPNISTSRYTSVSVLMIMWEDEDPYLPVSIEIAKLHDIFQRLYGFKTEVWRIPGQKSHAKVNRKILDLADVEGNPSEHLLIVYYAGHGLLTTNRLLAWTRFEHYLLYLSLMRIPIILLISYDRIAEQQAKKINARLFSGAQYKKFWNKLKVTH